MLSDDMKRIIREQRLGFVATVTADGTPNVSPKATFVVIDDTTIAFGDLRSPGTIRNLRARPAVEVNFVDPFVRKGYRFGGIASIVGRDAPGFAESTAAFAEYGDLASRMRAIVKISVSKAIAITSPAYDNGSTEAELRRMWTSRFRKLQPNERYEE